MINILAQATGNIQETAAAVVETAGNVAQNVGITGNIQGAFGCLAAAIGVGIIGTKAVEAVGRNPGASGKILVQSILGMALAEAVAFYALFLGK
ncbi:MAG: ATP synthase F0 subunit C [Opitutaceae bacterium]|jgi:F-type H+-transporting ATPase subunit c|nr:ATP synthase F0 subunit C [Opitutaceae bacterium]